MPLNDVLAIGLNMVSMVDEGLRFVETVAQRFRSFLFSDESRKGVKTKKIMHLESSNY